MTVLNKKYFDNIIFTSPVWMGFFLYFFAVIEPQLVSSFFQNLAISKFKNIWFGIYIFVPPVIYTILLLRSKNLSYASKVFAIVAYVICAILIALVSLFMSICMAAHCGS